MAELPVSWGYEARISEHLQTEGVKAEIIRGRVVVWEHGFFWIELMLRAPVSHLGSLKAVTRASTGLGNQSSMKLRCS